MPKNVEPVPAGYHTLTPHLAVKNAAAYLDFLKSAFGAVEQARMSGPGGKIMHAQVQIGDSVLMLADDFAEEFHLPPLAEGRLPFVIHMYVPDVDALWPKAIAAGCKELMPLADQFWGDRYGHLQDPSGFVWGLATHKEDLTPEQMKERQQKAFAGGGCA
jgi:PhnB protein